MKGAENLLWEYYESHWKHIEKRCWGNVYAREHKELIDKVNDYAESLGVKLDQSKFRPIERDFV